jgi:hypothetical protein
MPPELHNLIGGKLTHAGIYTEAIVVHGPPVGDLLAAHPPAAESKRPATAIASGDD